MIPFRARTVFLLLGLLPGLAACAEDLGREWKAVDAESSKIAFAAPGLETQKARFLSSYNSRQSVLVESASWVGPKARHAKAVVLYLRASPGYYLVYRTDDPQDLLEYFDGIKDKAVTFGPLESEVNGLGPIKHRSFGFEGVNCVIFLQHIGGGDTGGDRGSASAGDQQVIGYYCADPGLPLERPVIQQVVTSIDIR